MSAAEERTRPLVLVADDDEDILSLVSLQLERGNMEVIQARSGDEALALAEERLPDLAVLDVMMPGLNGYEVVKRLRGNAQAATMPLSCSPRGPVGATPPTATRWEPTTTSRSRSAQPRCVSGWRRC